MSYLLCLFFCVQHVLGWQSYNWEKFSENTNAKNAPDRLITLMWTYYEDANQRITETNHMRFMYEESPHYEMGYVVHELIERYKKMVEEMHRLTKFKTNILFGNIERADMMQKLYFEVYHICNMIHEIPRKWKGTGEFREKTGDMAERLVNKDAMKELAERQRREERQRKKLLKKRREMLEKGLLVFTERPASAKRNPYNLHWPLDYGWEIDWW